MSTQSAAPPHPFRESTWYEPEIEHRPCQCPRCRGQQEQEEGAPRLRVGRIVLVVLLGVLLPLGALVLNRDLHAVELGAGGTVALLLAAASALLNLVLYPRRRIKRGRSARVVHVPPRSTAMRVVLLCSAQLACVFWAYLGLLFLPLVPLLVVAVVFFGLGVFGLAPYGALAVSVIQAYHAARCVAERIGRARTTAVVLATLLALPVLAGILGVRAHHQRMQVERAVERIEQAAPHSTERMAAIATLRGLEDRLVDCYVGMASHSEHVILAEAYLRLTDRPIHSAVEARRTGLRLGNPVVRPWWFLEGTTTPLSLGLGRL